MLTFVLERFSKNDKENYEDDTFSIIETLVRLKDNDELEIDMGDFIHPEAKMARDCFFYKLVATINHYGTIDFRY